MTDARARVMAAVAERGAPTPKRRSRRSPAHRPASSTVWSPTARSSRSRCRRRRSRRRSTRIFAMTRLNPDQRAAADDLSRRVADRAFSATLLEGVTGSGKTEVYFEAVAEALRQGRQGLVLAAGDCAHRAIPRPVRGPVRRAAGRMALGAHRAPARARLGRGRRRAKRGSSSARVRLCSCRSPTSASSSSTRSTTAPTSRRTGSSTMRATWRSCARGSNRRRSCSPRRRPRSRRGSTPRPDATAGSSSPRGSARRRCPTSPPSILSARGRRAADGCRRARSPGSKRRGAAASRRSCSSIGAATLP